MADSSGAFAGGGGDGDSGQKKRQKKQKKYFNSKKAKCHDKMAVGMRGILIFGADHEGAARREAYNILNEYADDLFGGEFDKKPKVNPYDDPKDNVVIDYHHGLTSNIVIGHVEEPEDDEDDEDGEDGEDDIEKSIAKEIDVIKKSKPIRRFKCATTGVKNILFVNSTLSPCELNGLVRYIMSDVEATNETKVRNFARMVPVSYICKANIEDILKIVTREFLPELDTDKDNNTPKRFCVNIKTRFNNSVSPSEIKSEIAAVLMSSGHIVDLTSPDKVIIIEIMKGMCCISMVDDFYKFKRYNMHEIVKAASKEESKTASKEESKTASKEESKTASKEESKTVSKEESKTASKEESKTASKEESKTASKEESN